MGRYANRAAWFIDVYSQGVSGPVAVWANQKYHRHQTIPPEFLRKLKDEFNKKYGNVHVP